MFSYCLILLVLLLLMAAAFVWKQMGRRPSARPDAAGGDWQDRANHDEMDDMRESFPPNAWKESDNGRP